MRQPENTAGKTGGQPGRAQRRVYGLSGPPRTIDCEGPDTPPSPGTEARHEPDSRISRAELERELDAWVERNGGRFRYELVSPPVDWAEPRYELWKGKSKPGKRPFGAFTPSSIRNVAMLQAQIRYFARKNGLEP